MARLTKSEREAVLSIMTDGIAENQTMMDDGLCAYTSDQMSPREILMRKYRIIRCIKCLIRMGRKDIVKDLILPEIVDLFPYMEIASEELEYDDGWQNVLMEVLASLNEFGEQYLFRCLENTGWKLSYICSLEFYEELEEDVIMKCKNSIEFHWGAFNTLIDDDWRSEYLTSLGLRPDDYLSFYPDCNVLLINNNIREMLRICERNPYLKKWEEYKELRKFWDFALFDRHFPSVSNTDFRDSQWVCLNYMLGEVADEKIEETGFYQLNYETVICLMLADMVAEEFMERYQAEVEETEDINERRAS